MSKKRRRELESVDLQLVEIYENLANEDENIRLKAARTLLLKICPDRKAESVDVAEILRRLIRGLCSGRKAARLGFSVALTECLSQLQISKAASAQKQLQTSEFVDILEQQTQTSGNVSGQEERDHQFGRLFGAEAFIKSGVLFDKENSSEISSRIFNLIFELAKKKPWLREECGWIVVSALQALTQNQKHTIIVQMIIDRFCEHGLGKTPEGLAAWILVRSATSDVVFPPGVWHCDNPLHTNERENVSKILREASAGIDQAMEHPAVTKKSNWSPKLHFAWSIVLAQLLTDAHEEDSELITFEDFWMDVIEHKEISSRSLHPVNQVLGDASEQQLRSAFSPNLMRCLMNQIAWPERYLNRVAQATTKTLMSRVERQPATSLVALRNGLDSFDGSLSFNQLTKTNIIERLITLADNVSLGRLVSHLEKSILRPGVQTEKLAAISRQVIADLLVVMIRSRQPAEHLKESTEQDINALTQKIFSLLFRYSYFHPDGTEKKPETMPNPAISVSTREMFRTRITSCLTCILNKFPDPATLVYNAMKKLHALQKPSRSPSLVMEFDQNLSMIIDKAWIMLKRVHKMASTAESNRRRMLHAFTLMYSLAILQIYNGDADSASLLDELELSYQKFVEHHGQHEQRGSEILVEILLSFIAKPSALFRRLAQMAFSAYILDIDNAGLSSLTRVLKIQENIAGQDELFDEEDEALDEGSNAASDRSSSGLDDEEMEGVVSLNSSGQEIKDLESDDATDSADSELIAFDAKLAQALGTRTANSDLKASSPDDSSMEDMGDEQMEALDEHIAKIFREKKKLSSKKAEKKNIKESMINFKCRVLELIELFVKHRHSSELAFELLLPLLITIRVTTSKLVVKKACNVMREYSRLCKGKDVPQQLNSETTFNILRLVHAEAMVESSNAHASACSQASLLLVKALVEQDWANLDDIIKVYVATQKSRMLNPGCKVKMSFFTDWQNWWSNVRPKSA
ncbi:MAG: hypothetical protein Q9214_001156 [Letrouitia sp. 1 TL-2023]